MLILYSKRLSFYHWIKNLFTTKECCKILFSDRENIWKVIVWLGITYNGIWGLFFVPLKKRWTQSFIVKMNCHFKHCKNRYQSYTSKYLANSPNLNLLDYFMWMNECEKRDDLIRNIKEAVKKISLKKIQETINQFYPKLTAVFRNNWQLINEIFK